MAKYSNREIGGSKMILKRPWVTEKTAMFAGEGKKENAYAFEIDARAGKGEVERAVKELYKVTPRKINIVRIHGKESLVRGRSVRSVEIKKAYVFLKPGDKIDFS